MAPSFSSRSVMRRRWGRGDGRGPGCHICACTRESACHLQQDNANGRERDNDAVPVSPSSDYPAARPPPSLPSVYTRPPSPTCPPQVSHDSLRSEAAAAAHPGAPRSAFKPATLWRGALKTTAGATPHLGLLRSALKLKRACTPPQSSLRTRWTHKHKGVSHRAFLTEAPKIDAPVTEPGSAPEGSAGSAAAPEVNAGRVRVTCRPVCVSRAGHVRVPCGPVRISPPARSHCLLLCLSRLQLCTPGTQVWTQRDVPGPPFPPHEGLADLPNLRPDDGGEGLRHPLSPAMGILRRRITLHGANGSGAMPRLHSGCAMLVPNRGAPTSPLSRHQSNGLELQSLSTDDMLSLPQRARDGMLRLNRSMLRATSGIGGTGSTGQYSLLLSANGSSGGDGGTSLGQIARPMEVGSSSFSMQDTFIGGTGLAAPTKQPPESILDRDAWLRSLECLLESLDADLPMDFDQHLPAIASATPVSGRGACSSCNSSKVFGFLWGHVAEAVAVVGLAEEAALPDEEEEVEEEEEAEGWMPASWSGLVYVGDALPDAPGAV